MIPFEQIKYNNNHFVHNKFERFFTGVTFLYQIIDKWRQLNNPLQLNIGSHFPTLSS